MPFGYTEITRLPANTVVVSPKPQEVRHILDEAFEKYHQQPFVEHDPISIPHRFTKKQDIEIIGFIMAVISWGNRLSIIKSGEKLLEIMNHEPHAFILDHGRKDLKQAENFVHRTFQGTDLLYFIHRLQQHYRQHDSLEDLFTANWSNHEPGVESALINFHEAFFDDESAPQRTRKHVATPARKSACKRLNMFLRWMVRPADSVDFGLWNTIEPKHLMMPLDVHVRRVAETLGLLSRKQNDWRACLELTENLRQFDPNDPVKYDFALFGLGVNGVY